MSVVTTAERPPAGDTTALTQLHRTRLFALPEVRWATLALLLFLVALPLQLTGAPSWTWAVLYAVVYAAGGWEPGRAGLQALRDKTLDVDLLMVVAAVGAAAIGQVMESGRAHV